MYSLTLGEPSINLPQVSMNNELIWSGILLQHNFLISFILFLEFFSQELHLADQGQVVLREVR